MKRASNSHWSLRWMTFIILVSLTVLQHVTVQAFTIHDMQTERRFLQNPALTSALFSKTNERQPAALRTRTPKQHNRREKKAKHPPPAPLNESDLIQHVNAKYVTGPGGPLRGAAATAARMSRDGLAADTAKTESDHIKLMHKLDRHPALLLNADYQPISFLPLSMWHWQEAIKAVFSGKVTVVDIYPGVVIRAANLEIPLPSVIALNEYVRQPNSRPAFTKKNVFLRDQYRCQYCNDRFHTRDLSLDHVMPRSMGGTLCWENAVTSCRKCNGRKGSLMVNQLKHVGMQLLREPYVPTQFQLHAIAAQMLPKKVHPSWAPYLGLGTGADYTSGDFSKQELPMEYDAFELFFEDIP